MLRNKSVTYIAIVYAILAALFYGFGTPLSKPLLLHISPYLLASLLSFGAGIGMLFVVLLSKAQRKSKIINEFNKKELKNLLF